MSLLGKLFSKSEPKTPLEEYVDGLTPDSMQEKARAVAEEVMVPYAQTMTVFLFARVFTKGLRGALKKMPAPFASNEQFPHDRLFAEVVGFYYFVLMKDFMSKTGDSESDIEVDDDCAEDADDPYAMALWTSLNLSRKLVHSLSSNKIPEMYVSNRAISYSLAHQREEKTIEVLETSLLRAWNVQDDGRPSLDISTLWLATMIRACIASMPIEDVASACRNFYEEKLKNPNVF